MADLKFGGHPFIKTPLTKNAFKIKDPADQLFVIIQQLLTSAIIQGIQITILVHGESGFVHCQTLFQPAIFKTLSLQRIETVVKYLFFIFQTGIEKEIICPSMTHLNLFRQK